ncbi:MAG: DUF501 domain-containing protein [Candidatus Nanopelagicales bacterium]
MTENQDQPDPVWDAQAITAQLGREPRGVWRVAARCSGDWPAVVETDPRLPDGTPFPTLYYLTCRRLNAALSTLEAEGVMAQMQSRLADDSDLQDQYKRAHDQYIAAREQLGDVPEIHGFSAGGMPERVKCLHALVAHSLGVGPGVNPFGDEALELVAARGLWPHPEPCVTVETEVEDD